MSLFFCICDCADCWCINSVEMAVRDALAGLRLACPSCARGEHMTGMPPINYNWLVSQQLNFMENENGRPWPNNDS